MYEQRLDRIESNIDKVASKVDDIAKVVVVLARMEEKHIVVASRLDNLDSRANRQSQSIDKINIAVATNTLKAASSAWFIRLLIASLVGVVAYMAKGQ